eukprot:1157778-Pelagomonas_calceolata.AAC.13
MDWRLLVWDTLTQAATSLCNSSLEWVLMVPLAYPHCGMKMRDQTKASGGNISVQRAAQCSLPRRMSLPVS